MTPWEGPRLETNMGWEGEGPFHYTSLSDPQLTTEFERTANPTSQLLGPAGVRIDSVTFQPCLVEHERSQDRLVSFDVPGVGVVSAVFDGMFV